MFLADTDLCIGYLRGERAALKWFQSHSPNEIVICSVVRGELAVGVWKSRDSKNFEVLERFLALFPSDPFDDAAAAEYGRLRARLEVEGHMIGANDSLIAAIALSNRRTVVTRNEREFRRAPGLRVETW
jgi:tRNA(fMet)-specific endonuclease VapC